MAVVYDEQTGKPAWFDEATGVVKHIVTSEKDGSKALWDGKSLVPIPPDVTKMLELQERAPQGDILKEGREMAVKEAGQASSFLFKNVAIPAAQAGLALATGGMSIPAQAAIGTAAEGALQATGVNEPSGAQLALAAGGPLLGKLAQKAVRAGTGAFGRLVNPDAVRQEGVSAAAKVLGQEPDLMARALNPKASKNLYDIAERGGFIPASQAHRAVTDALRAELAMANPNPKTVETLQGLAAKYASTPTATTMVDSADLLKEAQRLNRQVTAAHRTGDTVTAETLKEATTGVKSVIPGVKAADEAYTKEKIAEDIFKRLRIGNQQAKIDQYIEENGRKMLGAGFSKSEIEEIRKIATRIGPASTAPVGFTNRFFDAFAKPMGDMLADVGGRKILRLVLGPEGKASPAALNAALTFWRGYQASKANEAAATQ